ncbi:dehydrogenase [Streptococcus gallolyticus subsp. gallolyticus]|uniref:NAD(P)-dependent oxidoreductase n=1 Tax=Streptococcus gallolyticus TaxID=315405 RepID=UPI0007E3F650|nr:NAD(P)-dependent oxidoreductase [Streptococcus gallolyticus]MCY7179372.1 dehydrogenase [Streptococcus gallolyticus subsp. gallolyticus]MCY7194477.1 dehydrogenase [Streptococcus gallolyticus subsp. gallolyticus]MCY7202326.1 dehydrogenase [Streptococcus gallolyticus subsp. gallolyticus]OAV82463.1 dehydrogenase [Streptococcus gallolyticus subsp. gallolyticus]OCW50264.1 dehydrogenase [Streptococcus gallolyticus subsp. gallolyticus]
MLKVLISDYPNVLAERDLSIEVNLLKELLPADSEISVYPYVNEDEFIERMSGVDVLLTAFLPLGETVLEHFPDLKGIAVNATGTNTIDLDYAEKLGIAVRHLGAYSTEDVANHTISLLLALNQKLFLHRKYIEAGFWNYQKVGNAKRLSSQTLAIFGLGRIGQAVAKRAQSFGMTVIAYDPFLPEKVADELGVKLVSIETIQAQADVISLHLFANSANKHFFNRAFFKGLKKPIIFINVARGSLVDELALAEALDEGKVIGAGLDVLESENPDLSENPFIGRDNVLITPHAAFYSQESLDTLQTQTVKNAVAILKEYHHEI